MGVVAAPATAEEAIVALSVSGGRAAGAAVTVQHKQYIYIQVFAVLRAKPAESALLSNPDHTPTIRRGPALETPTEPP